MNEMVKTNDNPLWFIDDNAIAEYASDSLAGEIFDLADAELRRKRRDVMNAIVATSPAAAEIAKGMKRTQRLKLVFSDEVKKKLADGSYKLMKRKDKNGVFKAVIVDGDNKIRAIADLKWDEVVKGVDPVQLTSAMQGAAIQMQLKEISDQLEDMSNAMEAVLIGQHNDRLALYYSGAAIFREALATSDVDRRKQLTTSSILALTEAIASLEATLAYEIKNVCSKYDEGKGKFVGIKSDSLREKMFLINSSFQTIHKATTLKAAIYYKDGEYGALTTVLSDYKSFLERSLSESNAHVLYLADPGEKKIDGTWNIRKNELPERIDNTRRLLQAKAEYALEVQKEELA